jgi:hypothetical protein
MRKTMRAALMVSVLVGSLNIASAAIPILLTINDSDPAAVTITATGANAGINFDSSTVNDGVDLLSFFSVNEFNMTFGQDLTGTLQGGSSEISYNDAYSDDYSSGGGSSYYDLELYVD